MGAGVNVDGADALIASSPRVVVAELGREAARGENRCAAVKVLAAGRIHLLRFDQVLAGDDPLLAEWGNIADKAALAEVATTFDVPPATARSWVNLAGDLEVLPELRAAFLAGDLTVHRAKAIAVAIAVHPGPLRSRLECAALAWSSQPGMSTREVISRVDELCIELDPDQAARDRESFADQRDVRIRPDRHGHANLSAFITAQFGVEVTARIDAMIASVCTSDPRGVGQRRVDALQALIRGEARMTCQCGDDLCPSAMADEPGTAVVPSVRTVVHVHTDAQTLAGLRGEMVPVIVGHGPVDPDLARMLATDATWRGLYDDAVAVSAPDAGTATGFRQGRGRPAGVVRDGFGLNAGHHPPPGPPPAEKQYVPSATLREWIIWADQTCRFPGCDHPAERCDLDHIVPFTPDHADPERRGLTVRENLAAECRTHHHLKTAGMWTAVLHSDRSITWTDTQTGRSIVTWPRNG